MPRKERKHSETGIYHVMLRGINRQDIFDEDADYWTLIRTLFSIQRCEVRHYPLYYARNPHRSSTNVTR